MPIVWSVLRDSGWEATQRLGGVGRTPWEVQEAGIPERGNSTFNNEPVALRPPSGQLGISGKLSRVLNTDRGKWLTKTL